MRIDGSPSPGQTPRVEAGASLRQSVQVAVLKKALEGQKQEARALLDLMEPKGRVIDIRV